MVIDKVDKNTLAFYENKIVNKCANHRRVQDLVVYRQGGKTNKGTCIAEFWLSAKYGRQQYVQKIGYQIGGNLNVHHWRRMF